MIKNRIFKWFGVTEWRLIRWSYNLLVICWLLLGAFLLYAGLLLGSSSIAFYENMIKTMQTHNIELTDWNVDRVTRRDN